MRLAATIRDEKWAENRRLPVAFLIGLTTFGILALELALIRWTSSQVRAFAYFNNIVLIGAFLGMGVGVGLGRRFPGLLHLTLPVLIAVSLPLAFAEDLGLVHLTFPDSTVIIWGGTGINADLPMFARNIGIFLALFTAIVAVFVCTGAPLGYLFSRLTVYRAYGADLAGSLAGIVAFAALSWLDATPAAWLALGALPFAWLARSYLAAALAVVAIVLGQFSIRGALFSPYNRIDLEMQDQLALAVNRDFHQNLYDLSDQRFATEQMDPKYREILEELRRLYDLPFVLNERRGSALIVGGGTGNDVQAALRHGYEHVTSVDIDRRIMAIGRDLHPEKPYSSPRVVTVVDDARSYFSKADTTFDVVCYGLLDSHAMTSAMSTLRLDNYVYTVEGIRAAWERVGPGGHLSLAISCAPGRWFFERLYWTVAEATGREPMAFFSPLHISTVTFVVPRDGVVLSAEEIAKRSLVKPLVTRDDVLTPSDDWPFLYLRPGAMPWGYMIVIGFVLTLAYFSVRSAFDLRRGGGGFDLPLFLMGAAFLLIETRGVTSMSLLFGSTWVVNVAIFAGILLMVLLANAAVAKWKFSNPIPWFCALFAAVALLYLFPVGWLHSLPLGARLLLAGFITGLPVGFAGVIVPMMLARSPQPSAALGSNLLGAVLGGCLEYFSMAGGLRSTALLALVLYLLAFLVVRRRSAAGVGIGAGVPAHAA